MKKTKAKREKKSAFKLQPGMWVAHTAEGKILASGATPEEVSKKVSSRKKKVESFYLMPVSSDEIIESGFYGGEIDWNPEVKRETENSADE